MKKAFLAIGLVALFAILITSEAWANHGYQCGSKSGTEEKFFHKAHLILRNRDELKLNDKQYNAIKTLKVLTKKRLIRWRADIDVLAVDIKSGMYKNPIDLESINIFVDQKYESKKEKSKGMIKAFADLKAILDEKQWVALKQLWKAQQE